MKQRDPIDLHEYAPGQWSQKPYYETDDGRVDPSKMTDEDLFLYRQALHRQRPPRPPQDPGLGFVLMFVVIVAVSGVLRLFGLI